MIAAVRQRVTVKPGGVVEIHSSELRAGEEADVIVLVTAPRGAQQTWADDDIDNRSWLASMAQNPALGNLSDAAEDPYTLNDGKPIQP